MSGPTWVPYEESLPARKYQTAHYDPKSDVLILCLVRKQIRIPRPLNGNILEMFSALSRHLLPLFVVYEDFQTQSTQLNHLRITRMQ